MRTRRFSRRSVPEINATSTADIAFILLIFFLVCTSMGQLKGLSRQLSLPSDSLRNTPVTVKERNLMIIYVAADGEITCREQAVSLDDLSVQVKHFITNPDEEAHLPEISWKDDPLLGHVRVTEQHVLLLRCDPSVKYQTYFRVQNCLTRSYAALREEYAQTYLHRPFDQCTLSEQEAIALCCPQRITEAQLLVNEEGGKP